MRVFDSVSICGSNDSPRSASAHITNKMTELSERLEQAVLEDGCHATRSTYDELVVAFERVSEHLDDLLDKQNA